jgi:hypothetical protein
MDMPPQNLQRFSHPNEGERRKQDSRERECQEDDGEEIDALKDVREIDVAQRLRDAEYQHQPWA